MREELPAVLYAKGTGGAVTNFSKNLSKREDERFLEKFATSWEVASSA